MIFSTYPPKALPQPGDIVCLEYGQPETVVRRIRNEHGQVFLILQNQNGIETRAMVEAVHWWPQIGDIGTGVPAIYQRWLTALLEVARAANDEARVKALNAAFRNELGPASWLYRDFTIRAIQGNIATVTGEQFHGSKKIPVPAIAVIRRPAVDLALNSQ